MVLRSTGYSGAKSLGHGVGYQYPHDDGGYNAQRYLPESLTDKEFYQPSENGFEARIKEFLGRFRTLRKGDTNKHDS